MKKVIDRLNNLRDAIDRKLTSYNTKQPEMFDFLDDFFTIVREAQALITLFDKSELEALKLNEKGSFQRFAIKLKQELEFITSYVESLETIFHQKEIEKIEVKIHENRNKLQSAIKEQDNLITGFSQLFEIEDELKSEETKLNALLKKKQELTAIKDKLDSVDQQKLKAEIETLSSQSKRLEDAINPMKAEKANLEQSICELKDAYKGLSNEIKKLQTSNDSALKQFFDNMPSLFNMIEGHLKQDKDKLLNYNKTLNEKKNEEQQLSKELQQTKDDINSLVDKIKSFKVELDHRSDILKKHFEADTTIVANIFSDKIEKPFEDLTQEINQRLIKLDNKLKELVKIQQEIAEKKYE